MASVEGRDARWSIVCAQSSPHTKATVLSTQSQHSTPAVLSNRVSDAGSASVALAYNGDDSLAHRSGIVSGASTGSVDVIPPRASDDALADEALDGGISGVKGWAVVGSVGSTPAELGCMGDVLGTSDAGAVASDVDRSNELCAAHESARARVTVKRIE
jgi:hypothetical protein